MHLKDMYKYDLPRPITTTTTPTFLRIEEATSNSTLRRLQRTLREICRVNAAVAIMVGDLLLVPAQSVKHLSAGESSSEEESTEAEEQEEEGKEITQAVRTHLKADVFFLVMKQPELPS